MTKHVVVRAQRAKGRGPFKGPDRYVAVVTVPDGVPFDPAEALRADRLNKRGITFEKMGEGYREHSGPRSALGRAIAEAERLATQ